MIISDSKEWAENTRKQSDLEGLSENHPKNAISQKGLVNLFWKLVKLMSYMCTSIIKSKQTSYRKVRLDVFWGKCVPFLTKYLLPRDVISSGSICSETFQFQPSSNGTKDWFLALGMQCVRGSLGKPCVWKQNHGYSLPLVCPLLLKDQTKFIMAFMQHHHHVANLSFGAIPFI